MAGFKDIIGHEQIIEHLQNAIGMDKVSHAYIINGPDKSGKMMLAEAFAMALQCEKHGKEACMECHSCRQALGHNQPDIIYVNHEKPNTISVDDIRTQVNNDIDVKPYSSEHKIYIIDEAEKMNQQAQNALLKTIEEPPAYAIIMLLTTNADTFLPTILSRCVTLNIKVVPDEKIKKFLMEKYQIPDYQADVCVAFAQGNVGKAIQLASSDDFNEMKASALLIQTIEENYKLGIDYYAQVDFFSFVDVIDAFGGVTINVEQAEVEWINGYIAEYNQVSGVADRDGFVDEQFAGGQITLTGKQALGYARIRKIGNDFARTQRQRTVMNALLEKVKKANVVTIYKAVESILPDISTNISDSKMCSLLMQSVLYLNYDMVQARVPADGTWSNAIMGANQEVLAVDFGANKSYLQSTIYE